MEKKRKKKWKGRKKRIKKREEKIKEKKREEKEGINKIKLRMKIPKWTQSTMFPFLNDTISQ